MNSFMKQVSLWVVLLIIVIMVLTVLPNVQNTAEKLTQDDFIAQLEQGNVEKATITLAGEGAPAEVNVKLKEKVKEQQSISFKYAGKEMPPPEWETLRKNHDVPPFEIKERNTFMSMFLLNVVPLLLIIGVFWFFMFRQMQGTNNKAMSFGKSRARLMNQSDKTVTFDDVAGVDEAKEELQEVVAFLKDPKKFGTLGGKIPRGVLLVGSPGAGKTLLARAVAGEANVPFFSISGSDFVEMFVGVGASRVRDLFQQGHKHAPCIIFIDELDAVGRQRGAGMGGGHDEREQTLNQLLVEMDGFNTNEGVILMAATNRPDVLDRALLRPGRFDRQIMVTNPDIKGRKAILEIHIRLRKVPLDADVDTQLLARGTPGFSGADLENMVNEAALLAARRSQTKVNMIDFEDAKDRVMMGPARRSMVLTQEEKLSTAYHEAGHTLLACLLEHADPVHKVTIIPRGPALGVTSMLPEEDRHSISKQDCLARIRVLMAGRAAEEIIYNEYTSGASSDIKRATQLAHSMVCEWGMSDLGPVSFGSNDEVFLGRDFTRMREFSDETASAVDREIHKFLDEGYKDAKQLLEKHQDVLEAITQALYEKEILDAREVYEIIDKLKGADFLPPNKKPPEPPRVNPNATVIETPKPAAPEKESPLGGMSPGDAIPGPA